MTAKYFPHYWPGVFPSQGPWLWYFRCYQPEQAVEQTAEFPMEDPMTLIWRHSLWWFLSFSDMDTVPPLSPQESTPPLPPPPVTLPSPHPFFWASPFLHNSASLALKQAHSSSGPASTRPANCPYRRPWLEGSPSPQQLPPVLLPPGKDLLTNLSRAYSRFAPSQWETVLLCNDVSHWLGATLESALLYPTTYIRVPFQYKDQLPRIWFLL